VTTKTATPSIKDLFSNPGVLAAIAAPIVGVLAGQADRALDRMRQTRERQQGFKSMMDMHPDLRETKHPEFVANVYNSLSRANPYIATDPFVAGSMIKNIVRSHEHINPQEATGYFLESFDRATGQRGQLSPRGDGPGPISSFTQGVTQQLGSQLGEMQRTQQRLHEKDLDRHQRETGVQAAWDKEKADRKLHESTQMIRDEATRAREAAARAQALTSKFTRLTGVELTEDAQARAQASAGPSLAVRQFLNRAADEGVRSGLAQHRPHRKP
jgi:hypothetical protein